MASKEVVSRARETFQQRGSLDDLRRKVNGFFDNCFNKVSSGFLEADSHLGPLPRPRERRNL